ncbi:MAG: ArdC family protein [Chloroflexota bacterium]
MTAQQIQEQVNEMTQFAIWLAGALFLLYMGRTVGKMEKDMVNSVLDMATPESIPVRIPQTKVVTVTCPICGKVIEIPEYSSVTRSEALRRHMEKEHTSKVGLHPQALMIEGGEKVPSQYHDLVGLIDKPLPGYSLSVDLLPALETEVKARRIDEVMKQLKDGVEGIQDSYQFRLFLTTMSKFHDYSIGNQILIMIQKPDAIRVAGFNTWKDMGRWVRKGEKGIAILAPVMPPKQKPEEKKEEEADTEIEPRPVFFKVVYIFENTSRL